MFSWRSQEQYWQFKNKMAETETLPLDEEEAEAEDKELAVEDVYDALDGKQRKKAKKEKVIVRGTRRRKQYTGKVPEGLPAKFYNKEGEIDLRQVTGDEAYKYFAKIGMPLPVINKMR